MARKGVRRLKRRIMEQGRDGMGGLHEHARGR